MKAIYFAAPAEFRAWLEAHHAVAVELLVGFHKVASGRPSLTWPQSVDEALCFGWIDGVRTRVDDTRYTIRFTPRKPRSIWSAINVRRVRELTRLGRMRPAGERAFAAATDEKTAIYAYEQRHRGELPPAALRRFRADGAAWRFWQSQPPSYQKTAIHWVVSAKQEATRERRLSTLIADSANGLRIAQLRKW